MLFYVASTLLLVLGMAWLLRKISDSYQPWDHRCSNCIKRPRTILIEDAPSGYYSLRVCPQCESAWHLAGLSDVGYVPVELSERALDIARRAISLHALPRPTEEAGAETETPFPSQ